MALRPILHYPDKRLRATVERATFHYWSDLTYAGGGPHDALDLAWFRTGWPAAALNRVTWTRFDPVDAAQRIDAVKGDFASHGLPFRWTVTDDSEPRDLAHLLVAAGFRRAGTVVPMAVDLERMALEPGRIAGVSVRRVESEAGHRDFCDVTDASFFSAIGQPFRVLEMAVPARVIADRPRYVAYVDGRAVAGSVLVCKDGLAGVYAVGTLPAWRRRGLGALMTVQALRDGRERGFTTGILHASAVGAPVYARLGFAPIGFHDFYEPSENRVN
jgi:GNAT superfamily N-acetyltransferase